MKNPRKDNKREESEGRTGEKVGGIELAIFWGYSETRVSGGWDQEKNKLELRGESYFKRGTSSIRGIQRARDGEKNSGHLLQRVLHNMFIRVS